MVRLALVIVLLCAATAAHAEPSEEELVARKHYDRGSELYARGDYGAAITEFEVARRFHPSPAFEFNIGRCLEALGRTEEAKASYRRFIQSTPAGSGQIEVRARLDALERWQPGKRPSYVGPGVLLGATLAVGLTAAVLFGTAKQDYDGVVGTASCMPCDGGTIDSIDRRQKASIGLVALSGALLVGDLVWFGITARRRAR